jgi:hypothetical protein
MSLTYSTLKTEVLAFAHRPDLTSEVAGFVRLAEGMLRREPRAYEIRVTLDEADRSAEGLYNLPTGILELRAVYLLDSYALENVGLQGVRMLPAGGPVMHYGVSGTTIEFRGVPATDVEIEIVYYGWPDELSGAADTNWILEQHEALYIYGALHYLYTFTQDLELAAVAHNQFGEALMRVNEQIARRVGGGSILPAYNFGHTSTSSGY